MSHLPTTTSTLDAPNKSKPPTKPASTALLLLMSKIPTVQKSSGWWGAGVPVSCFFLLFCGGLSLTSYLPAKNNNQVSMTLKQMGQ